MIMTQTFRTHYFDEAVLDLAGVIENAKKQLAGVDFDTIVGTGFSGGIVIPTLALAMGKKFVLIRKEGDDSHHGGGKLVGQLGERWIFVDDFVSSGKTCDRVISKIGEAALATGHRSTMVGQYMYARPCRYEPRIERDPFTGCNCAACTAFRKEQSR